MFPVASRILGISIVVGAIVIAFFTWLYPTVPVIDALTIITLFSIFLGFIIDLLWRVINKKSKS